MSKIKITLNRDKVSVIANLKDEISPNTCKSFVNCLPVKTTATHARWCGDEIWAAIKGVSKYEKESETMLPNKGEILLVPVSEDECHLTIWYGRGWCFGPEGFVLGNVVGEIENLSDEFIKACNGLILNGRDEMLIEIIED